MQINEDITVNLSPADLKEIVKDYLVKHGYSVESIRFDIKEKCEGIYPDVYVKYFDGASCKVKRA